MKNLIARMIGLDQELTELRGELARAEHTRTYHQNKHLVEKARAEHYKQERDDLAAAQHRHQDFTALGHKVVHHVRNYGDLVIHQHDLPAVMAVREDDRE